MTDLNGRTVWSATELMATTFPEPRWAVPGLLPEGLTLLVGPPKVGKSWLALGLAVSVAAGGRALGKIAVDPGHVLYLALEDPPRRLQRRLGVVLDGGPTPERLAFAVAWERIGAGGAERLDSLLSERGEVRLVVVDVLAKVRPRPDARASAYDGDYAALMPLKEIADRHGVAVVVVHHVRKAGSDDFLDTVSGTHGLAGSADTVAVLTRARSEADGVLQVTGRDVEEMSHPLSFAPANGQWLLLDGPASDYTLGDTRRAILGHLRERGIGRPKEMANALGVDHELMKKTVKRMADDGQLDTNGRGVYTLSPVSPVSPLRLVEAGDTGDNGESGDTGDTGDTE